MNKYNESRSMKANPVFFLLSVVLIFVFGIGIIILLIWYLRNQANKLILNDNEILFEEGLLSKHRSELNISSVRTVKIKQSFVNRLFGIGTIEIYTAGDRPEIIAQDMPNPNKIRELIKNNKARDDG